MTCAAWAALAALAAPRLRRLRLDVHCTGGAYSLRCSTPTPTAARCVLLQRRWRLWLLNALFCSDSTRAALAALAATLLKASSAGFVGLGVPMLASTQARPTAAEHLRRRKLDVCCSSGAGNTGCSTVTSAAARWVPRGRRSHSLRHSAFMHAAARRARLRRRLQLWLLNYPMTRLPWASHGDDPSGWQQAELLFGDLSVAVPPPRKTTRKDVCTATRCRT